MQREGVCVLHQASCVVVFFDEYLGDFFVKPHGKITSSLSSFVTMDPNYMRLKFGRSAIFALNS